MERPTIPKAFDLSGRGVAITGGGGHLGAAMAFGLAEAGAIVVVSGRTQARLDELKARASTLLGRVETVVADASTDEGIDKLIDAVELTGVRCAGFVNNAYAGRAGRLLEVDREAVEVSVKSALTDVIMATQRAALRMKESGGGSIVNIASMYGIVAPQPNAYATHPAFHNPPAYGAAKAGVIQFSRYAAVDLAEHGIRVNSISPGAFPSPAVEQQAEFVRELSRRVPLGRIGRPRELAGAVVYLVSDASSYVTGHDLVIDGGWTAW